ncbi:MAG: PIG-L family deacetylase [Candidatus Acidiferrales bacterium]
MKATRISIVVMVTALLATSAALAAPANPELDAQLARLPRISTVVYVTAHPDDESGPVLTYFARGLHARVVLLCVTRGEGGQNQAGSELGEELALVRARELRAATDTYGAELRFLGAEDFGYSKSLEETFRIWDEATVLAEMVRQFRELRPIAVLSAWSGTERDGGGAHHRAAGVLARKAFAMAGDPNAFPEQIARGYLPWQPRFFLTRRWAGEGQPTEIPIPATETDPVSGKTFEEIGWEGFRNHRSQGMGSISLDRVGRFRNYTMALEKVQPEGVPAPKTTAELAPELAALPELFPAATFLSGWRERLGQAASLAGNARRLLGEDKHADAALALVQGAALLTALRREVPEDADPALTALLDARQNGYLEAAAALAGVELVAFTDRAALTPGEQVWVGLSVRVGAPDVFRAVGFEFGNLRLDLPPGWGIEPLASEATPAEHRTEFMVAAPQFDPARSLSARLRARATLTTGSLQLELRAPVRGLAAAPIQPRSALERLDPRRLFGRHQMGREHVHADLEPVYLAPPLLLDVEPGLRLLAPPTAGLAASPTETIQEWCVRLQANRPGLGKVNVWVDVPHGWYTPLPVEVDLATTPATRKCFPLTVPANLEPGNYTLEAGAGWAETRYRLARRLEREATTMERAVFELARAEVRVLDLAVPAGLRIGYIGFPDDPVPALLVPLGVTIDMLDERTLPTAPLSAYDAIVIANRAYDFRADLAEQTPRLLEYAKGGGVLIVEHQGRGWDPQKLAPYPAVKSGNSPRVTVETAPVRVLLPKHALLNSPNRIGADDWDGWVQERGLYFWESWPEEYQALLEMADPGEPPQRGSLLYARYGEGAYIYCGLALFRQVRAGVPGGVRLYLNLLSHRRALQPAPVPAEKQ